MAKLYRKQHSTKEVLNFKWLYSGDPLFELSQHLKDIFIHPMFFLLQLRTLAALIERCIVYIGGGYVQYGVISQVFNG